MKKNSSSKAAKTARKRTSKKQSIWSQLRNSRRMQVVVVAVLFGLVGAFVIGRSFAATSIGIHIAPRATNMNSRSEGPRQVTDSTAAKRNVQSVYVAPVNGAANQVSVTQALKKGTYEVCTVGRPTVGSSTGKLRVSDKPYGTQGAITVEEAFKATPTTEYIKLACPLITLPSDMTVYISHVVTAGGYNFSIDAITEKQAPAAPKYPTAESAGVPAGTTLTKSTRTKFDKDNEVVQGLDLGCIEVFASNVTIKNSRVTCNNSVTGTTPSIDGTHWSNAFKNMTIENVTIEGIHYRAIELMPNSTVKNVKIVGQGRGIAMGHFSKVENTYISLDNSNSNCKNAFGEGHAVAIAFFSAHDVVIKNNHVEMKAEKYPGDACISGGIAVYPEKLHGGRSYNVVFDGNRLVLPKNDRHYHISLSYSPGDPGSDIPNYNVQVINNRFEGRDRPALLWNSYPQTGDVLKDNLWCPNAYGSANASTGCYAVPADN